MNQGARLLKAASGSQGAKARRLHVSTAFLSQMVTGKKVPGHELRLSIEANWGVPYGAWEIKEEPLPPTAPAPAQGSAPPPLRPAPTPIPGMTGGTVDERLQALQAYLSFPGRAPAEVSQARELRQALVFEARLASRPPLHEHPDWAAHVDQLVAALARVPGALEALEACLGAPEDERAAA